MSGLQVKGLCALLFAITMAASPQGKAYISVQVLINSGEENPSFDLTREVEWEKIKQRLHALPQAASKGPAAPGSGFLIVNHGVRGIPAQVEVSHGVITVFDNEQRRRLRDTKGLEQWLDSYSRTRLPDRRKSK